MHVCRVRLNGTCKFVANFAAHAVRDSLRAAGALGAALMVGIHTLTVGIHNSHRSLCPWKLRAQHQLEKGGEVLECHQMLEQPEPER